MASSSAAVKALGRQIRIATSRAAVSPVSQSSTGEVGLDPEGLRDRAEPGEVDPVVVAVAFVHRADLRILQAARSAITSADRRRGCRKRRHTISFVSVLVLDPGFGRTRNGPGRRALAGRPRPLRCRRSALAVLGVRVQQGLLGSVPCMQPTPRGREPAAPSRRSARRRHAVRAPRRCRSCPRRQRRPTAVRITDPERAAELVRRRSRDRMPRRHRVGSTPLTPAEVIGANARPWPTPMSTIGRARSVR